MANHHRFWFCPASRLIIPDLMCIPAQVQTVERVVEVPQVQTVERVVEVPQLQVQEVVRQVMVAIPQEVVRQVPVPQARVAQYS